MGRRACGYDPERGNSATRRLSPKRVHGVSQSINERHARRTVESLSWCRNWIFRWRRFRREPSLWGWSRWLWRSWQSFRLRLKKVSRHAVIAPFRFSCHQFLFFSDGPRALVQECIEIVGSPCGIFLSGYWVLANSLAIPNEFSRAVLSINTRAQALVGSPPSCTRYKCTIFTCRSGI